MSSNPLRAASVGALLLLPALALAAPSTGGQPSLRLRWSDPNLIAPTTERDFDTQLTARLGRPAFAAGADEATLAVTWEGTPEQCRVELSLTRSAGEEGTRVIESPSGDCQSLVSALLTVSALLVDSYERSPPAEAAPVVVAPSQPAASAHPPGSPPPPQARILLSVGGALSSGFVPKLEIGPAAAVTWAPYGPLRLGVAGSWFIGHDYGEGPGLSLDHRRAALFVCGMPLSRSLGIGLCGNLGLHHFEASGTSLPRPEANSSTTWSLGAELRAEWRLTRRLWWVGHAGADMTTRPLYFYYLTAGGDAKNLFDQRRINPVLLVALSLELP
ncbi:MAG: hypothetical protein EOO73_11605 [Myxococcales bacterium]|nr:MAG: hypothetical protein EOO73_11605 [Myxococcales bacterium]